MQCDVTNIKIVFSRCNAIERDRPIPHENFFVQFYTAIDVRPNVAGEQPT